MQDQPDKEVASMTTQDAAGPDHAGRLKVLVSAASMHGATTEIAEAIAAVLAEHGIAVTMLAPADVGGIDSYDAVVIGSALYLGHWLGRRRTS